MAVPSSTLSAVLPCDWLLFAFACLPLYLHCVNCFILKKKVLAYLKYVNVQLFVVFRYKYIYRCACVSNGFDSVFASTVFLTVKVNIRNRNCPGVNTQFVSLNCHCILVMRCLEMGHDVEINSFIPFITLTWGHLTPQITIALVIIYLICGGVRVQQNYVQHQRWTEGKDNGNIYQFKPGDNWKGLQEILKLSEGHYWNQWQFLWLDLIYKSRYFYVILVNISDN